MKCFSDTSFHARAIDFEEIAPPRRRRAVESLQDGENRLLQDKQQCLHTSRRQTARLDRIWNAKSNRSLTLI
jgi:hypothetical protein